MTNTKHVEKEAVGKDSIVGVFGWGGFAREIMPLMTERFAGPDSPQLFFVHDEKKSDNINDHPVLSFNEFLAIDCASRYSCISVGKSDTREFLANNCLNNNVKPLSLVSKNAIVYECNSVGVGAVICANVILTSNVEIGDYCHLNLFSYVAHDCKVGDYVTFAPRVCCNGNVHIKDHAYIGTNAVLKQGTETKPLIIGEGAVVGMGAVVTKDVEPYTTVVGNPARPLQRKS